MKIAWWRQLGLYKLALAGTPGMNFAFLTWMLDALRGLLAS